MSHSITTIKVVLASANLELLEAAKAALGRERAIKLVGEARGARQALQLVSQRRPTLFIVDLALPPAGGLLVLARVRRRSPKTRALTIDEALDERQALRVAKAGAYGYMLAKAVPGYLAKAVRCMDAGEVWFSRKLTAKIVDEFHRLGRAPAEAD